MGSSNHSQLATQPIDDEEDENEVQQKVWGKLLPQSGTFPQIPLSSDSFKLGRGSLMDYVIKESDMGSSKWLTAVSKCQCEIFRDSKGVFIRDHSSNGTWVNGSKIGKNQARPLDHDSDICFAGAKKKVFVYRAEDDVRETFPEPLTEKYIVSKVLGRGACGEVRLGFRVPDLHRVAIKIICKRTTSTFSKSTPAIMNEVRILQQVNHPCVIRLEDVIDTPEFLYIVLELAEGGELFEKIIEKTKFNEAEAKLHFYQMVSAIQYLHAKNICHRDLKPENVLLCSLDDSRPVVKITDMGLSKLVDLGTVLKTFCGTPNYLAPEVIHSASASFATYTLKVDCWSLGVILYILLSGTPPFSNERKCGTPLRTQIERAHYFFYPELFNTVSQPAKDLITNLLKAKPEERLSADDIMNHPWLDDPAVRKKAETLMREQASQSHQPIRSNYQPNPPIRGTNLQMTTGQQPMRGQQQPLKPSNQINGPGVTLTLMKRPVPMDVDPDPVPEKKNRVEISLIGSPFQAPQPPHKS